MISEKQLAANRENARKSTGPKTEAGKNRSKLNAVRHCLTGQVTVMTEQDRIAFEAFTLQIVESFHPKTAAERQLAHVYATSQWRINRAAALEEGLFTLALSEEEALAHLSIEQPEVHASLNNAAAFRDDPKAFDKLSLYTNRLISQSERVLRQLKQLQAERKAHENSSMLDAVELYRYHKMKELPFDPRENGFVFSNDEIRAYIHRQKLAFRAENARKLEYNRAAYDEKYENQAA